MNEEQTKYYGILVDRRINFLNYNGSPVGCLMWYWLNDAAHYKIITIEDVVNGVKNGDSLIKGTEEFKFYLAINTEIKEYVTTNGQNNTTNAQ